VAPIEGEKFARTEQLAFIETSAKDGTNCTTAMQLILQRK
jgi:hypothetical protein